MSEILLPEALQSTDVRFEPVAGEVIPKHGQILSFKPELKTTVAGSDLLGESNTPTGL